VYLYAYLKFYTSLYAFSVLCLCVDLSCPDYRALGNRVLAQSKGHKEVVEWIDIPIDQEDEDEKN
jgi:hypothetical protein